MFTQFNEIFPYNQGSATCTCRPKRTISSPAAPSSSMYPSLVRVGRGEREKERREKKERNGEREDKKERKGEREEGKEEKEH